MVPDLCIADCTAMRDYDLGPIAATIVVCGRSILLNDRAWRDGSSDEAYGSGTEGTIRPLRVCVRASIGALLMPFEFRGNADSDFKARSRMLTF